LVDLAGYALHMPLKQKCSGGAIKWCDEMTVADFLRSLPTSDVVVWTDGSVSSLLGAGVQVACRRY